MDKYTNFLKLYNKYDINDYIIIKSIKNENLDYLENQTGYINYIDNKIVKIKLDEIYIIEFNINEIQLEKIN